MISAIAITGPTASGKTALSLDLGEKLGCEIICCDSMQIYRRMDIGTAKATADEKARLPHHMLDVCEPWEDYSAENYRQDAMRCAREIAERGKTPLFVGGTGLYIDTVMRGGAPESPPSDPELHSRLLEGTDTAQGREQLWQRLKEVDPESAEKTHMNNARRVARALEIYLLSGVTKTEFDKRSRLVTPDISVRMLTLVFHNRDLLYERVDRRVDQMMSEGLVDEVRALYRDGALKPSGTAAMAIGYKELLEYIEGRQALSLAVEQIKQSSRRYAKRQLTWFRHESGAFRIYVDDEDGRIKSRDALLREALYALAI